MANYDSKYLKYKNKYINLKNEQIGGGTKDIIILYDDTNPVVNSLFQKIKDGYTNHYNTSENIKKKYYIDDSINLKKELNCLLNIYTYILGDNKIESEFRFKFNNLKSLISGGSRRMQILLKPFNKAIKKYKESSKIELKDNNKKYIITNYNCDSLKLQLDQMILYINTTVNLNNSARITSTKTILELVKLHQNMADVDIIKYQSSRIGKFVTLSNNDTIIPPSGTITDIKLIGEESYNENKEGGGNVETYEDSNEDYSEENSYGGGESESEEQSEKEIKEIKKESTKETKKEIKIDKETEKNIKIKEYLESEKNEFILNLNISNLTFNNLNNMIHLRLTKNIFPNKKNQLFEVINIFNK